MTDYYKVLGLTPNATQDEIKTAYRKLSKKFHPDMNQGDKFFEERFKEIQEAYEKLTNFKFRTNYDKQYKNKEKNSKQNNQSFTQTENVNNSKTTSSTKASAPKQQPLSKPNRLFVVITFGFLIVALFGIIRSNMKGNIWGNAIETHRKELNSSNNPSAYKPNNTRAFSDISNESNLNNLTSSEESTANPTSVSDNIQASSDNVFNNSSKEEIKSWLLKTLQENSQNRVSCPDRKMDIYNSMPCIYYNDYEFNLTDEYLIVRYNLDYSYDEIVYIPFYDYKWIYGKDYEREFSISTNSYSMYKVTNYNISNSSKRTTDYIPIGFKNNSETNLIKKIGDALSMLKVLSSKPTTSDLPAFLANSERPSLDETRNWFTSKLKAYTASNFRMSHSGGGYTDVQNLTINLQNNDLILEYNVHSRNFKVKVPLCKALIRKPSKGFGSDPYNQCTIEFSTPRKMIEVYSTYSELHYRNSIQLKVDLEREEDLFNRFKKALKNLKSYCPQDTKAEEIF